MDLQFEHMTQSIGSEREPGDWRNMTIAEFNDLDAQSRLSVRANVAAVMDGRLELGQSDDNWKNMTIDQFLTGVEAMKASIDEQQNNASPERVQQQPWREMTVGEFNAVVEGLRTSINALRGKPEVVALAPDARAQAIGTSIVAAASLLDTAEESAPRSRTFFEPRASSLMVGYGKACPSRLGSMEASMDTLVANTSARKAGTATAAESRMAASMDRLIKSARKI